MSDTIREKSSESMYIQDMVQYGIVIDRRRALPDIRDGMKPVNRKIIFDMLQLGATNHLVKSARITGDTMGKYHAHGDSSIYSAMVDMASWFKNNVPMIVGQGNWGTIMGDGAAAPRYTEARLSDFAYEVAVSELQENAHSVDWKDNFDRTLTEPEFLPCKVPLLLINGSFGIGLGISVNIPSHNLVEVLEETRKLMKDPSHDVVLVPDYSQPVIIYNTDWNEISNTGFGKFRVQGIIEQTEVNGLIHLIIKSLPFGMTTDKVRDKLLEMAANKQLPMVKDIIDQSKMDDKYITNKRSSDAYATPALTVILKKGADPNYVKQIIYTKTGVQQSIAVNFEAVNDLEIKRYSYTEYLKEFIQQRIITKYRLYCNKMKDAMTRYHKLDAYVKFIESGEINTVIKMVQQQKSKDNSELVEFLIKKCNITDLQAQYILATNISQLSKGYLNYYKAEYDHLGKEVIPLYHKAITDNGQYIMQEIDKELLDIEHKYGKPRMCQVIDSDVINNIPRGIFKIIITENNYIRKVPFTDHISIVRGDNPKFILKVDNAENILLFDNKGKVFKLPVYKIPVSDRSSFGTDIRILAKNLTSNIINVFYEPMIIKAVKGGRKHYMVIVTKNNVIKKLDMEDFLSVNASGLIYSKLKDDDEVAGIAIAPSNMDVVIYSDQKALRMPVGEIPLFKRNASGSKAMNTDGIIEGIAVIYPDAQSILIITNNGRINKFPITGLAAHNRARAGINVIKLDNADSIFSIYAVSESDIIQLITAGGPISIPVSEITSKSSIAAGQRVSGVKPPIIRCDIMKPQ